MDALELFKKKFNIEELFIGKIGDWVISLRPEQLTLGSLVLSLNRSCESLGDLTPAESKDLAMAFSTIDDIFLRTFNPDKINYLALMMVDNQVHFHVIPRYKSKVEFNGSLYSDNCWPKAHDLNTVISLSCADSKKLVEVLSDSISG